jgi:hypothetical protein
VAYLLSFGFADETCVGALGRDVAVGLVGAGTLILKVGKFALSMPIDL